MKIVRNSLAVLVFTVSFTSHINSHQVQSKQSTIVTKLKKAWQNNWVKAGTVTAACALLYALGAQLNSVAPAVVATAAVCTGAADCSACHQADNAQIVDSTAHRQLWWKAIGIVSFLATGVFGYAYFTSQEDDNVSSTENSDDGDAMELSDDFFDISDEDDHMVNIPAQTVSNNENINDENIVQNEELPTEVSLMNESEEVSSMDDVVTQAELQEDIALSELAKETVLAELEEQIVLPELQEETVLSELEEKITLTTTDELLEVNNEKSVLPEAKSSVRFLADSSV